MQEKEEKNDIIKMYEKESLKNIDEFVKENNIDIKNGLNEKQIEENIKKYGLNEIRQNKPKQWYNYFFESLLSPFNLILLGIAVVLIYTDVILPETKNYSNIIVILILIAVSTLLEFFEVFKSNKAAEKLKSLIETKALVLRNGKEEKIALNQITVGDIVILSAGDIIPADLKIIEAKDLYVSQSTLTGESEASRKVVNLENNKIETITDLNNVCFMGTNVTSGYAKAVVIKTGDNTYFGKIAHTVTNGKPQTAFQKGIKSVSKLLIKFMLVMIPIIFILNVNTHGTLVAFTFAVAIAIGITPLLLPVILSSSLAKGAVKMSKKKTIIKKLDSIQSFGAMNILCTDKTGTLTEDKIVLEKYLDIKGEEDMDVLKHVYLNSYFQTGLKGNIDEAIIARGEKEGIREIAKEYKKIDEIPFDFSRRRLSIVVTDGRKEKLITKGAIEEILNICTKVEYKGEITNLTEEIKTNIKNIAKNLNEQGLRVLGICEKTDIKEIKHFEVKHEEDMILMGFIGFLDPPKESAKEAINMLNNNGIRVIVLTGDNEYVTKAVCEKVNINTKRIVLGSKIDKLSDKALQRILKDTNIFAKLSPIQKARIVRVLGEMGNIVGYMGDGINDSPPLVNSEVGISVDTAVDIAKETADIILLEKDLKVLNDGVIEGRKTFGNLMKYIKLAASFNFGEVSSILIASVLLPFFPITPIQLLVQSLIYDIGQLSLPMDNVDDDYVRKPRKWSIKSIKNFMIVMGPTSAIFDLIIFATLWFVFGIREAAVFQTIWFSYGIISNLIGLHIIRTAKKPFIESNASKIVYIFTAVICVVAILVPFTFVGKFLGLVPLTLQYILFIFAVPIVYCLLALEVKKLYIRKYGNWI
ncbi:MAG: magnesium-translocating P-type ATPase [Clostridia bacterium]|nr:magnesium-translocating P-type ATPase [Clostridia bacterium]